MADRDTDFALRDLLGLRDGAAWLFLVGFEAIIVLYMVRNFAGSPPIPALLALLALAAAGLLVLVIPVDPLPASATALVVLAAPIAAVLTMTGLPDRGDAPQVSTAFAASYVLALLVLRGRLGAAWIGVAATAGVIAVLAAAEGMTGGAFVGTIVPIGTVAGVSLFAAVMRPTQRSLRTLREEATLRAAAEATLAAENGERDRQLARLDRLARPMLERIAAGADLNGRDREECRLLEAELRDGLRAPQLVTDELSAAARGARARGVEVVLLDDGGFAGVPRWVRERVVDAAAKELDAATDGTVTVRVLPMGRRVLATVLAAAGAGDRRIEIDAAGDVRVST